LGAPPSVTDKTALVGSPFVDASLSDAVASNPGHSTYSKTGVKIVRRVICRFTAMEKTYSGSSSS